MAVFRSKRPRRRAEITITLDLKKRRTRKPGEFITEREDWVHRGKRMLRGWDELDNRRGGMVGGM